MEGLEHKPDPPAAEQGAALLVQLKQRLAALQNTLSGALADAAVPGQPFAARVEGADGDGLRRMAAAVANRTGAPCCLLAPGGQGLAYALAAAPDGDVRPACKNSSNVQLYETDPKEAVQ